MEDDIPHCTDNRKDKHWNRSKNRCWDNTEEDHEKDNRKDKHWNRSKNRCWDNTEEDHEKDNRKDKHWNRSKNRCWDNTEEDHEKEEVKVGEEVTGEIEHSIGQFSKTLPKQPVTTGEHDPIQFDDTVVMDVSQVNNVNIKVKSLVAVDDVTPTDGVLTEISDGVENITREGEKITDVYPHITDVTITGGGGNSYENPSQFHSQPRPDLRQALPERPQPRSTATYSRGLGNSRGQPGFDREGSRGSTPSQQPNRKSPTLDQSTHVPIKNNPEKPSESHSQSRHDLRRPPHAPKSTSSYSRGFRKYHWFLGLVILCFGRVNGNPIVDWQSDSMVLVFGETWNLTCSKNDSIVNETCIWSRRRNLKSAKTETINFGDKPKNSTKFEIDGSTVMIKNGNEKDIRDYCYFCRIGTTPSHCKNILDQKNHVVIPSKTAVTFPMNKTIRLQSGCYPNLTFFMIIENRVVANQTATKKDNNRLYEIDMTFNGTLKGGEQFLVIARHGNKNITVYNSTDLQIIKHKEDTDFSIGKIIGVIIGVLGVVGGIIALCIKKYKRRQHQPTTNRDRNDSNDEAAIPFQDKGV